MRKINYESSIPSWLETPPQGSVNPPVITRNQELPFNELTWEAFEKLCLRLARSESDVEHCQQYGTKGQNQEGIDLYAKEKQSGIYRVYQCKRERNFGPTKIKGAVKIFLKGQWANKAKAFILCTTESLIPTERADAFEEQRAVLLQKDIALISWSKDQLAPKLKEMPEIVDDFFGREWVTAFCGEEQAARLGCRLDGKSLNEFRSKFSDFYQRIFNKHDPGLPLLSDVDVGGVIPFNERYVLPDIKDRQTITHYTSDQQSNEDRQAGTNIFEQGSSYSSDPGRGQQPQQPLVSRSTISYQQRHSIENWLSTNERIVVLGQAGSGKSALLRFVAVELLQDAPRLAMLAKKWGQYLPVWVPFALWTKKIADAATSHFSLSDLLKEWLHSWNEDGLWPFMEQALNDKRLLLLVDGLDEWSNVEAAGIALDRLQLFVEQRDLPAIVTSRHHGFSRLGMQTAGWRIGTLADFSTEQQTCLASIWFKHRIQGLTKGMGIDEEGIFNKTEAETQEFMRELRASVDLQDLAAIPLLLSLLIVHHVHKAHLPLSRFKAYRSLIEHLLSSHPRYRRKAASISDSYSTFSEDDLQKILAYLAFQIHEQYSEGMIDENDVRTEVEHFLKDGDAFGFSPPEARGYAREIAVVGENEIGLLVRKSQTEIAFYHRAFQEYLAGYFLAGQSLDMQLRIVSERCADPQWREVILALFSETKRASDTKQLVEAIKTKEFIAVEHSAILSLLSEIAFGDFNCPVDLTRILAEETFREIEVGHRMSQREHLLKLALTGLRSVRVKDVVQEKLIRWFPRRGRWRRSSLFAVMAKWPNSPEVVDCLLSGIHDEQIDIQRQAARSLASLAQGDATIGKKMAVLASRSIDPDVRASAFEGLLEGWSSHDELPKIVEVTSLSPSPQLRLMGILGKIKLNIQSEDDLNDLLHMGSLWGGVDYWRRDLVAKGLITGWSGSVIVRDACLKAFQRQGKTREVESEIATQVLLQGYAQDHTVTEFIAQEIENLRQGDVSLFFSISPENWLLLSKNFRDHPLIVKALDAYLLRPREYALWEVIYGALVGRTEIAKGALLKGLKGNTRRDLYAESLLDGWGMEDAEVAAALRTIVYDDSADYGDITELLPRIIEDPQQCNVRQRKLYQGDDPDLRARIILAGLGDPDELQDGVDIVLEYVQRQLQSQHRFYWLSKLFALYPTETRVKEIAKWEALRADGDNVAVASAFGYDREVRESVISIACPLPSQLRQLIARQIGDGSGDEDFALSLLSQYDQEDDPQVLTESSIAYHRRLKSSGSDLTAVLEKLSNEIVSYGPHHDAIRQAALVGLITLNHLKLITTVQEPANYLSEKSCCIDVISHPYANIPLQRQLLHSWDYLEECLGTEKWKYLTTSFRKHNHFILWNSYCSLAHDYPAAREEALAFFLHSELAPTSNVLRFIAREKPKSDLLLENCLGALRGLRLNTIHDTELITTAAELLGTHFSGDQQVLQCLLASHELPQAEEDFFDESLIAALCEGWPDSDALEQIFSVAQKSNPQLSWQAYIYLVCTKSETDFAFKRLRDVIKTGERDSYTRRLSLDRPVLRRLQIDERLVELLEKCLKLNPSASEKASFPRLLSITRGVSSEIREWCLNQVTEQLSEHAFPLMGFDIVSRDIRPVLHSVLDVIETQ